MCLKTAYSLLLLLLWRQWVVGEAAVQMVMTLVSQPGGHPAVGHVTY